MKILQFAFGDDPHQEYLPHNYAPNCVVYTGTHDNDTTVGWYTAASEKEKAFLHRYTGRDGGDVHWDLIRLAFGSIAHMTVVPLQDVLGLSSEARMNTPGTAGGNWAWRFTEDQLTPQIRQRLADVTYVYGRGVPVSEEKPLHRRRHHSTHPRILHPKSR
jgi:4-alpha-glucanotransferase